MVRGLCMDAYMCNYIYAYVSSCSNDIFLSPQHFSGKNATWARFSRHLLEFAQMFGPSVDQDMDRLWVTHGSNLKPSLIKKT